MEAVVEEIVIIDKIIDKFVYLQIFKQNLKKCTHKLGIRMQVLLPTISRS